MFKDEYQAMFSHVTASQDSYRKVMRMTRQKKSQHNSRFLGKVLIAAVIVSMLAVTASASEFGLFTRFFGERTELSQEQIQYLENNTQKVEPALDEKDSATHTDVLQFVTEQITFQADANNTHGTGQDVPDYQNFKLTDLRLSQTKARLIYNYFEGMDWTKPCSISHLTVVLKSGEEIQMPIAVSKWAMDFEAESSIPLEDVSHILLPDGTLLQPVNEVEDGFAISLDSILTDDQSAYVTLNVTLPANLESPGPGWTLDPTTHFLEYWICPADQEKPSMEELVLWSSGVKAIEDGDGKDNTYKLVVSMTRDGQEPLSAFGSDWKFHVEGIEVVWHNQDNADALFDGKYAGQDVILDGDEVEMTLRYETLCWDVWDFALTLNGGKEENTEEIEFVTKPVSLSGHRQATLEEMLTNPDEDQVGPFEIQLVSLRISPLTYYLEYTAEDDYNAQAVDVGQYTLVMQDGRKIQMFQYSGRHNFSEPVILGEIDYVLLPNGVKLFLPK